MTVPERNDTAVYEYPLDYLELFNVFRRAFEQSSRGKGVERHAEGRAFLDQPIMDITRRRGAGFPLGQMDKKIDEAQGMLRRGDREAAARELSGALVYLAAAVHYLTVEEGA